MDESLPGMNFPKLKEIIGNFSSILSDSVQSQQNPSTSDGGPMDGEGGVSTGNERVAYKMKGYFDLAKGEIDKAVRAEEWGLPDDAISYYKNAQRILNEAVSTPVPSYISARYAKNLYFLLALLSLLLMHSLEMGTIEACYLMEKECDVCTISIHFMVDSYENISIV